MPPGPGDPIRFAAEEVAAIDRALQCLPGHGAVAVPLLLHVDEGVPVALVALQDGAEDGGTQGREGCRDEIGPVIAPVASMAVPEDDQEGERQEHATGTAQCRTDGDQPPEPGVVALPEVER